MSRRRMNAIYRDPNARGASARMPAQKRQDRYAVIGRVMVALLGLGLTALAGFGVVDAYRKVNSQKIETVQIEGSMNFVSETEIKETVGRFVSSSLMAIDLDLLKRELESQPWISEVQVRREWPGKLIIRVEEEQPVARWGERELLNQQGHIFSPRSITESLQLPKLTGPAHSEETVMLQYLQFNQLLYPLGVRIRDLGYNERGAWTMTLTNGIEVRLGRDQVLQRLRRLLVFLQSDFSQQMADIQSIDLRYRNGIAVSRRQAAEAVAGRVEKAVERIAL